MSGIILECNNFAIEYAAKIILNGGIVMIPTDTIYGLACDANNNDAISRLYSIKKRPLSMPIAIFTPHFDQITFSESANNILQHSKPGRVTIITDINLNVDQSLFSNYKGSKYLGIRNVSHLWCQNLLKYINKPLAVTSANISGNHKLWTPYDIPRDSAMSLDLIIYDLYCLNKFPSSIVRCLPDGKFELLRMNYDIDNDLLEYIKDLNDSIKS